MTTRQRNWTKVLVLAVLIIVWAIMHAQNVNSDPYLGTGHGSAATGVDRSCMDEWGDPYGTAIPKGNCAHCHEPPGACENLFGLFMDNYGANKNELCFGCHETFELVVMPLGYGRYGTYQGKARYVNSTHNTSPDMLLPSPHPKGPAYIDFGNCNNCHTPHGYDDESGVVPSMLYERDVQEGCYYCHGDNPAPGTYNIKAQMNKAYSHGDIPCLECHNPHTIGGIMPETPAVHYQGLSERTGTGGEIYGDARYGSDSLQGVWGVRPSEWPSYGQWPDTWTELKPPAYPDGAELEVQICLKCHSLYDDRYPGARNVAHEINPNNHTGHPIVATQNESRKRHALGANQMRGPWGKDPGNVRMYCTDCHGNDTGGRPAGVHGSKYRHMLKPNPGTENAYWPNYTASPSPTLSSPIQTLLFCWNCHDLNRHRAMDDYHDAYACTSCHSVQVHGTNFSVRFLSRKLDYGMDCHWSPSCGGMAPGIFEFWANNWASDVFWEIF